MALGSSITTGDIKMRVATRANMTAGETFFWDAGASNPDFHGVMIVGVG